MKTSGKLLSLAGVMVAVVVVAGSSAQTTTRPTIDLSVGPLAVTTQAVNVALALSVEFPTAGAAYRTSTYDHAQEYLGYWDPKGCYQYFDSTDSSALSGQYFRRTGTVDTDRYCDGSSYSGNVLNYAATSSIDLLRYALTGGNRVLDTSSKTVLGRAFLPTNFSNGGLRDGTYFPQKQVAAALVGRVTPAFTTPGGSTPYTGVVYFNSCKDFLYVGNASSGGNCDAPGGTNAFGPTVPDTAGGFSEQGFVTPPTNTSTTTYVIDPAGRKYWGRAQPEATTTVMPSGSDAAAGTLVPEAVSPTPRNSTVVSTGTTPQRTGDPQVGTNYAETGNLVTTVPPAGAPDRTQQGTTWVANSGSRGDPYYEGIFEELNSTNRGPNAGGTPERSARLRVCRRSGTSLRLRINSSDDRCPSGYSADNVTVQTYRLYTQRPTYKEYVTTPIYNYYQEIPTWYQASVYTVYRVYGTAQARMKAFVQVCDGTEGPSRQGSDGVKLCKRYPNDTAASGVYKPVGELQSKAEGVRVSAFGYAMEDGNGRYGGVLRAPMKFLGGQYRDTAGAVQTNAQAEWDTTTGVFTSNPLGDTTYNTSGVVNYLNKFGSAGRYKSNDPVGELYYEALRYFQGLQPTASAVSTISTNGYDNFPIYSTWTDPVQNACQRRNFILTIGDVNTHNDKQLPGHGSGGVNETSTDPSRGVENIPFTSPATATTFNALDWTDLLTAFETGTAVTYTDALGRTQTTAGNPNVVTNNTNLRTKGTGSGSSSAYYWAGAAYWANTQPIRRDIKTVNGQQENMKDIRVKTFTIDVDEGGNGSIDANTRGIKPRNSSFFLAGKYGWFNDANEDGNPFKTSGGTTSNKEWEDASTPTVPDGYVLASQAQRMITGIRKFFNAVSVQSGNVSASAVSSQRFTARSPNGDFYSPSFSTGDWSGTVTKSSLQLNTDTELIESLGNVTWDAGKILTQGSQLTATDTSVAPYLKPSERRIFTYRRESGADVAIAFTDANLNVLDAAMRTNLNTNPATSATDNRAADRINYLRGSRTHEGTGTNAFRSRNSVMGDVINSGPVFKQGADKTIAGDSAYTTFVTTASTRTAMIYVGANDGMLHAFRASDGKEVFAYIPLAVASKLNRLTNPQYQHTPYVDAVPYVGEAKIGSDWRTILASGMGGGAQGVFALDVTKPENFEDGTTGGGKVLFEFTDQDDASMGNVIGQPRLVKVKIPPATTGGTPTYKWFVAVGSGYNNYASDGNANTAGTQALFLLSLDKAVGAAWVEGTNYFKIPLATSTDTTVANGTGNPSAVFGQVGEVTKMYMGDLLGNLWRFDFTAGLSSQNITDGKILNSGKKPMFKATTTAGAIQPITAPPMVVSTGKQGHMVVFGTGKFLEPSDSSTTGTQSMYSVWDSDSLDMADYDLTRSVLASNTASESGGVISITRSAFVLGKDTTNTTKTPPERRGWVFDLTGTRERIAVEGAQGFSSITYNSTMPLGNCSGDGDGRSYTLNPLTGEPVVSIASSTNGGMLGVPIYLSVELASGNYTVRGTSGGRTFTSVEQVVSPTTKLVGSSNVPKVLSSPQLTDTARAGRLSWREIRNFKN